MRNTDLPSGSDNPPSQSRSRWGRLADAMFFPVRALFFRYEGGFGLSSMADERMRACNRHVYGRVLDLGCGPGNRFVERFLRYNSRCTSALGADVHPWERIEVLIGSSTALPFADASLDCVTLVAVGGHIRRSERSATFGEIRRVLQPGGRLVMTEGEPITQWLGHQWAHWYDRLFGTRLDVDGIRGMDEEEDVCIPAQVLMALLRDAGFHPVHRYRFQWRLNNVYVAMRSN